MASQTRTATRTSLSSSVTSMDDASLAEFKAAQDRRFGALQPQQKKQFATLTAVQAPSPPLKGRSLSVSASIPPSNTFPDPETGGTLTRASSMRLSTILTEQTATARTQVSLLEMQMKQAEAEIARAREVVKGLEAQRDDAERAASHANKVARRLKAENLVLQAREKGRKEGYQLGFGEGRALAMARVDKEKEKQRERREREQREREAREALERQERENRRRIEAAPPATTTTSTEEPASAPQNPPVRRSSMRQPVAEPAIQRSSTVSSTPTEDPPARPRTASLRAPSRVSIVEPPQPVREASVRSTTRPAAASRRSSAAPSALTSLDSLGLGTPRAMPIGGGMLPQFPPHPPPLPPANWQYPQEAEPPATFQPQPQVQIQPVHIPMRPPPNIASSSSSQQHQPTNININITTAPAPPEERNRTPTSVASSMSASLRNLTSFPTAGSNGSNQAGVGAGGTGRERELSVIMEHAEPSPSAGTRSEWTSPYADPRGVDMDSWRRGSSSSADGGEPIVVQPQPQPQWQYAPGQVPPASHTPQPIPIPAPQMSGGMLNAYPYGQPNPAQPNPSQDSLNPSSSSSSTVNITIVPPSRPTSGGQAMGGGMLAPESDSDSDDSDGTDDDIRPPGFYPTGPMPAFAQGVPSGFVPSMQRTTSGQPIPPGAVSGGVGVEPAGPPRPAYSYGQPPPAAPVHGFAVESARPNPTPAPTLAQSRVGGAPPESMFVTERPASRLGHTPTPAQQQMGGIIGAVPPATAASWNQQQNQPVGIVRPPSRQGGGSTAPIYAAPTASAAAGAWGQQTPARPPSRQGSALYAPRTVGATGGFTVESAGRQPTSAWGSTNATAGGAGNQPYVPAVATNSDRNSSLGATGFTVESTRPTPQATTPWGSTNATVAAHRSSIQQGAGLYGPPAPAAGNFTVESARATPAPAASAWGNPSGIARPPSRQGSALYAPQSAPNSGLNSSLSANGFTVESAGTRQAQGPPLLGTQGHGAFEVERPASRMANNPPAAGGGAWAMGGQFGFGQQPQAQSMAPQPTRPQAYASGGGNTEPARSIYSAQPSTGISSMGNPVVPAAPVVPYQPSVASSTTTSTSRRRRGSVSTTAGTIPAPGGRNFERERVQPQARNQTPHPSVNLGISSPYTEARIVDQGDGDYQDTYYRGGSEVGSDRTVSSLGMDVAALTRQNTAQNAASGGYASRRQSTSTNATGFTGHGPVSPAHSYVPMGETYY